MGELRALLPVYLLNQVLEIVWPNFVKDKSGLIFLERVNRVIVESSSDDTEEPFESIVFTDKTECEAVENHIHLEDELPLVGTEDLFQVAATIGEIWATKLKSDYPTRHFRVYLHQESDSIILRFHQIHKGEAVWFSEENYRKETEAGTFRVWNV